MKIGPLPRLLNKLKSPDTTSDLQQLKSEVEYRTKLHEIGNKINAAANLDEILIDLKDKITSLFEAERITVYVIDKERKELVSRFKSGDEISEIRIPISKNSLAGYSVLKQKLINIKNVYDEKELSAIDPEMKFDKSWDKKTDFKTTQVLVVPAIFRNHLLGAFQLINRINDSTFTIKDGQSAMELAKVLGIALFNQKRMLRARPNKFSYLLENQILAQKELDKAVVDARNRKVLIETILEKELKIPKNEIGKSLSKFYNVPFVRYNENTPIPGELLAGLKVAFMRKNLWVPLRIEDGKIVIVIDNTNDLQKIDVIRSLFPGKEIKFYVSLKQDILDFIKLFTHDVKKLAAIDDILSQLKEEEDEIEEAQTLIGEEDSAIVQLVNKIILDAYERRASDIHIEPAPGKESTQVRLRVDGVCSIYQTIPYNYKNAVISRIKIMAGLDIAERRKPQDGKIKFKKYGGKDIELRVATIPTQGKVEDIVLRILASGEPIPLEKMSFSKSNFENFVSAITKPYGIVFVCGPTGSGKTTTLHSALGYINKPEIKIWTAEDPVEISQKGLRQVQVQPKIGFDFAAAMRAFLRADPDVIMVGEMRDKETAQIGIEASLTGHLVFSTLHTNSAPESITRLLDMGMDPFNFADAVLCILAQRLVQTLCADCKQAYHPSKEEYYELVREYGAEEFKNDINIPYSPDLTLKKANGCEACNNSGYKGRMGIYELLMGTDEVKRLIQANARMEEIRDQAIKDGMKTLKRDGIAKIFDGHCDLVRVRKVCIK
ncbi:MAG: GspE/PulE family protein [Proteobacteria bacterium]|nr:GspE/PulE family protein [Pseudomonadota bacterium]